MIICDRCPRNAMSEATYTLRLGDLVVHKRDEGAMSLVVLGEASEIHYCRRCIGDVGKAILAALDSRRPAEEAS